VGGVGWLWRRWCVLVLSNYTHPPHPPHDLYPHRRENLRSRTQLLDNLFTYELILILSSCLTLDYPPNLFQRCFPNKMYSFLSPSPCALYALYHLNNTMRDLNFSRRSTFTWRSAGLWHRDPEDGGSKALRKHWYPAATLYGVAS
jgi:hypothetical protein